MTYIILLLFDFNNGSQDHCLKTMLTKLLQICSVPKNICLFQAENVIKKLTFHEFEKSKPIKFKFNFKFKFKSVCCISCNVFTIRNSTINQILSIRRYYTTKTQIVNKVTNYIKLGVFICDGCMLFNKAHHDVHKQHVQYIQDQCKNYNNKCIYIS